MDKRIQLTAVKLGSPRQPGEGLRIGTVRLLPRGVRKQDYARRNYFDVWLPNLAEPRAAIAMEERQDLRRGVLCSLP